MDLKAARKALAGPLRFGDPAQIAAVDFIARAESCLDAINKCPHGSGECEECEGAGECPHCGHECDECDGTGVVSDCSCIDAFSGDDFNAAMEIDREKKRGVSRENGNHSGKDRDRKADQINI
ncbi:MAG: hypothetical protein ABSB88_06110 [Bryobacteraceae bacterium]|jgi:RecJ-like exonuclease